MNAARSSLALVWVLALSGCQDVLPDIDLERMIDQPRGRAFAASAYFDDGRLMQSPPVDTVARSHALEAEEDADGRVGRDYVSRVRMPIDRGLLLRGRTRFEIYCAACHGLDGRGISLVAENMLLRKPPSLIDEPVRSFAAGRVYSAITHGYGLMPAYQRDLSVHDRWSVVAYLHVLQRSQSSPIAALPAHVRQAAFEVLR